MNNIQFVLEKLDKPRAHPFVTLARACYYDKPDVRFIKLELDELILEPELWSGYLQQIYPGVHIRIRVIRNMCDCLSRIKTNFDTYPIKSIKIVFLTKKYYIVFWKTRDQKIIIKFSELYLRS